MRIPLIKPFINEDIKSKVLSVLESGYLTEGSVTRKFEEVCGEYLGSRHCIAVSSCTVGLEMALRCMTIGPEDEVIVPDYTYPATADAVAIVGAKIILVDVNPKTMLIDYDALEEAITPSTRAVIPVSLFGNPLDYDRLKAIKKKFGIYIVEDAACALGAGYKDQRVGTLADITVFSLHPRKFITTGEGGLITTDNDTWAAWLTSYKRFGIGHNLSREEAVFERIGTNYTLSNVLAAIGLGQMQHINDLLTRRKELASIYIRLLDGMKGLSLPLTTPCGSHSYQSFSVLVENRDNILKGLRRQGIEVQIGTYSLHLQPAFQNSQICQIKSDMNGSNYAYKHCLILPLYHDVRAEDQKEVVTAIKSHFTN
jgi:dTDP-4-amino-4,6-dideoxygalactose transaminase